MGRANVEVIELTRRHCRHARIEAGERQQPGRGHVRPSDGSARSALRACPAASRSGTPSPRARSRLLLRQLPNLATVAGVSALATRQLARRRRSRPPRTEAGVMDCAVSVATSSSLAKVMLFAIWLTRWIASRRPESPAGLGQPGRAGASSPHGDSVTGRPRHLATGVPL